MIILCILPGSVSAGEVTNNTFFDYLFNWVLFSASATKLIACNYVGLFGLVIWNDNGTMAERCMKTGFVGARANFQGYIIK